MNILFFGYWGANEGLSQATINPHLKILAGFEKVEKITYVSIERTEVKQFQIPSEAKIKHCPYYSSNKGRFLSKLTDFLVLPFYLKRLIKQEQIDLLMCRSSLAGGIGYWAHLLTGIRFTVESFEPHADYMAELDVWPKTGISYRLQKYLEKKQIRHALHIMPVTQKHQEKMIEEGVDASKISVMPCAVDLDQFAFSEEARRTVREKHQISEAAIVGIYVGKFGDIYLDQEAFQLFKSAHEFYKDFQLILLSPESKDFINARCKEFEIPLKKVLHQLVPHEEVPSYLSAADFAFSLHKHSKYSFAFSPIKNGEYWANGLPIVGSEGIGDDSEIIKRENAGILFTLKKRADWPLLKMRTNNSESYLGLVKKYRHFKNNKHIYQTILLNDL